MLMYDILPCRRQSVVAAQPPTGGVGVASIYIFVAYDGKKGDDVVLQVHVYPRWISVKYWIDTWVLCVSGFCCTPPLAED